MPVVTCVRCDRSFLKTIKGELDQEKHMCGDCLTWLEGRINHISREAKEDVKAGKLKVLFRNIPPEVVPRDIQEMVEEVGDPEFLPEARIHKIGNLQEIRRNKNGIEVKKRFTKNEDIKELTTEA